ncbi:MAG TPA: MFS transporter [Anaerolineae bacterium]
MRHLIANKLLLTLFFSSALVPFVGMGLLPILPLYAAQFGASPTAVGVYYALMYLASLIGVLTTDWLARQLTYKGAFIIAGTLGIPLLGLMGQVTTFWQLVLLTAALWFFGTVVMTLVSVLTGLLANGSSRGQWFSLMVLVYPLGALLGGTAVGQLIARHGYPVMFAALGATWIILPAVGLFGLKGKQVSRPATPKRKDTATGSGQTFYLLLLTSLLSGAAVNVGRLGMPLSMQILDFSPSAVASTATASGLVTIPVVLLIGALSDRLGRKRFLMLAYALASAGIVLLAIASELWHFWLAATLLLVSSSVKGAIASAFAADILTPEALTHSLPRLNAMDSVASIVIFAGTGYIVDTLGALALYGLAAVLAAGAVLQLRQLRSHETPALRAATARIQCVPC